MWERSTFIHNIHSGPRRIRIITSANMPTQHRGKAGICTTVRVLSLNIGCESLRNSYRYSTCGCFLSLCCQERPRTQSRHSPSAITLRTQSRCRRNRLAPRISASTFRRMTTL